MDFSMKSPEYETNYQMQTLLNIKGNHTEIVQGFDLVSSFSDWRQTTKELIDERTKAKSKLQT